MQYQTKPFIIHSLTNTTDWKKTKNKINKKKKKTPSFTHSVYGQHYPRFLACNSGIRGNRAEAACQLNTLTMRLTFIVSNMELLQRTCFQEDFPPAQFYAHVSSSPFVGAVCADIARLLMVSPIWESFCFITDSVARTQLVPSHLVTHIPGLFWTIFLLFFLSSISSPSLLSALGASCPSLPQVRDPEPWRSVET